MGTPTTRSTTRAVNITVSSISNLPLDFLEEVQIILVSFLRFYNWSELPNNSHDCIENGKCECHGDHRVVHTTYDSGGWRGDSSHLLYHSDAIDEYKDGNSDYDRIGEQCCPLLHPF